MADATHYVDAPRRNARRGGIRAVAEFRTADSRLGLGGVVEFTSPGCGVAVGEVELCYPSPADTQAEKTRGDVSTLSGIGPVFGIYAGVECFLGGSDYNEDARRLLSQGADRAVEAALDTWLQAETPVGAVVGFVEAIAAADDTADGAYPGMPVVVMNRGDAVRAVAADVLEGDKEGNLWTPNGTPVLASAEITENTVAVVGAITVLEGAEHVLRTQDLEINREFAIAERVYAILVDCEYVQTWTVTEA